MDDYKIIVEQEHSTVAAHYEVEAKPDGGYQSEAKLEAEFIRQLQGQGYEYVKVKDEAGLLKTFINIKYNSMSDAKERLQMSVADIRAHYFELQRRLYSA